MIVLELGFKLLCMSGQGVQARLKRFTNPIVPPTISVQSLL